MLNQSLLLMCSIGIRDIYPLFTKNFDSAAAKINVSFWHSATFGLVVRWLQLLIGSSATIGKERLQLGSKLNAIYQ
jgi:hypothetical protein